MGNSSYSVSSRSTRTEMYKSQPVEKTFTQTKEKIIHPSMNPYGVTLREARDSETHPCSFPIIINLDVTGSMLHIPADMIRTGLPTMVSKIIQAGVLSPAVLFTAIGDHEADSYPFQVSQFESGDVELDMWLTRTYLEAGGGGNAGESYGLAHFFAANYIQTDSWDKRKQKGLLITIGDEPSLTNYPKSAFNEIMGPGQYSSMTDKELLVLAQEKWDVYHIIPGQETRGARIYWNALLGQNSIWVDSYNQIPAKIAELAIMHGKNCVIPQEETKSDTIIPEKGETFL